MALPRYQILLFVIAKKPKVLFNHFLIVTLQEQPTALGMTSVLANDNKPLLGSILLNKNTNTGFKMTKTLNALSGLSGLNALSTATTTGSLLGGTKPNNDCQQVYIFDPGSPLFLFHFICLT